MQVRCKVFAQRDADITKHSRMCPCHPRMRRRLRPLLEHQFYPLTVLRPQDISRGELALVTDWKLQRNLIKDGKDGTFQRRPAIVHLSHAAT